MNEELKKEIQDLVKSMQQSDSIEIGNAKTGVIKVYVDFYDQEAALHKLDNAISILKSRRQQVLE